MMGPFCPEQGTSSHETVIDLASTDEIVTSLTDEVGAMEICEKNIIENKRVYYALPDESVMPILVETLRPVMLLPYTPLRPRIQ